MTQISIGRYILTNEGQSILLYWIFYGTYYKNITDISNIRIVKMINLVVVRFNKILINP